MKKLTALILALLCALSLCACTEPDTDTADTEKTKQTQASDGTKAPADPDSTPADSTSADSTPADSTPADTDPADPDGPNDPGTPTETDMDRAKRLILEGKHLEAYVLLAELAKNDIEAAAMLYDFHVVYENEKTLSDGYVYEESYTYDVHGYTLRTVVKSRIDNKHVTVITNAYSDGKLASLSYAEDEQTTVSRTFTYNAAGLVSSMSESIKSGPMDDGEYFEYSVEYMYEYDGAGRLVKEMIDEYSVIEYEYDSYGNLTKTTNRNAWGDYAVISVYENTLDSENRVIKSIITESDNFTGAEDITYTVSYTYDTEGRVATETYEDEDGTSVISYTYDSYGNAVEIEMSEMSERSYESVFEWVYDADGNVVSMRQEESDGSVYLNEYDKFGNVTKHTVQMDGDTVREIVFSCNEAGAVVREEYYYDGVLENTVEYFYDSEGREIKTVRKEVAYDAVETVEYTYDENGLLTGEKTVTEYDGVRDQTNKYYQYDPDGRLRSVIEEGRITLSQAFDEQGKLVYSEYEEYDGSWVREEYAYDANGRCITKTKYVDTKLEETTSYVYDDAGRVIKTVSAVGFENILNGVMTEVEVTYDANGFMIEAHDNEGNSAEISGWRVFYRPGNKHNENQTEYFSLV